jgi:hypothetical protein
MPAIFRDENKKSTSVRRNVLSPVSLLYKEWGDDRRFPFFSCGPFTGVTQMYLNGWSVTVWLIPMTISLSKPSFFFFVKWVSHHLVICWPISPTWWLHLYRRNITASQTLRILFLPFTIYWMWATYDRQKKKSNQKGKKSHVQNSLCVCNAYISRWHNINDFFFRVFS